LAEKEGTRHSIAELHAMAKLSEIFAKEKIRHSRIAWICKRNDAPYPPDFDDFLDPTTSREEYFLLLSSLSPVPSFPFWLADLLETLVGIYCAKRMNPPGLGTRSRTRPTKRECRALMLQGHWGWDAGVRAIELMGYELTIGQNPLGEEAFVLRATLGEPGRAEEKGRLLDRLAKGHEQARVALEGAYEAYLRGGRDSMRQAMDSLRNALENLVRDFTGKDLSAGLPEISPDDPRRLALFKSLRDFLGVEGTHASDQPFRDDFLLAARVTEAVLAWILQRKGEW